MVKPGEIQKTANRLGLRDTQIEKDYVIAWVLKGIAQNDYLKAKLIFKRGTALRKIYFSNYRLSEDLDFTFKGDDYKIEEIKKQFETVVENLKEEARITVSIQDETQHQTGNYNFFLGYAGPLGGSGANKSIKVDIANDEILCNDPVRMIVNNEYSDLNDEYKIMCYTLREIITEKMRSLMQRTMPRDLYDLWYLLENENHNIEDYISDFRKKAKYKGMNPKEFVKTVLGKEARFEREWNNNLVNQTKSFPDFKEVWRTLRKHWKKFEKVIS